MLDYDIIDSIYRKHCTSTQTIPNESDIEHCQEKLNVRFPEEYRDYLMRYNGGEFERLCLFLPGTYYSRYNVDMFYSIGDPPPYRDLMETTKIYSIENNEPIKYLPIANIECGDMICLSVCDEIGYGHVFYYELFEDPVFFTVFSE